MGSQEVPEGHRGISGDFRVVSGTLSGVLEALRSVSRNFRGVPKGITKSQECLRWSQKCHGIAGTFQGRCRRYHGMT